MPVNPNIVIYNDIIPHIIKPHRSVGFMSAGRRPFDLKVVCTTIRRNLLRNILCITDSNA